MRRIRTMLAAIVVTMMGVSTAAQAYPDKPVRIIVPYPAGQGTDLATRLLAEHLTKALGQTFYVENVGGAGGNIGTQAAARAQPDGYTLTMGTNATHSLNAFLYASLNFDPVKDFDPVILYGTLPMVVLSTPQSPIKTVQDLLQRARQADHAADIGMPSTTARLVFELLKQQSGAPLYGIPYKGSATAISNLIGGQIPLSIDTVTAARPHIDAGRLFPVAVTSAAPTDLLPGVQTVASQGLPGFEVVAWNALYAPKGTPQDIITKVNLEIQHFLALPETRQRFLAMGYDAGGGTPGDLAAFAERERAKWGPLVRSAGMGLQ